MFADGKMLRPLMNTVLHCILNTTVIKAKNNVKQSVAWPKAVPVFM